MDTNLKLSVRGVARKLVTGIATMAPLAVLRRASSAGPLVVYYHTVSDRILPHIRPLYRYCSQQQFEQDLDALCANFTPVDLNQLIRGITGEVRLPGNSCHITFDDGLREVSELIAPILTRRGIPATFFVSSQCLDNKCLLFRFKAALLISQLSKVRRASEANHLVSILRAHGFSANNPATDILALTYSQRDVLDRLAAVLGLDWMEYLRKERPFMSTTEVSKLLRAGFAVGSHSLDHIPYSDLPLSEQLRQTREDMDSLATRFSLSKRVFAFPFHARGVGREFFETLLEEGSIEMFFGTSGWFHDRSRRLVNRVSLEGDRSDAIGVLRQTLALELARRGVRKLSRSESRRSLPRSHLILPASVRFSVPGFRHHDCLGVETLAPQFVNCDDWFERFADRVRAAIGKTYLPVCRISDGEFMFLLDEQPLGPVWPWHVRLKQAVKKLVFWSRWRQRFEAGGRAADGTLLYGSGSYSAVEWQQAREGYTSQVRKIAEDGILAIHLTHGTPHPFQQHYFPAFGRWLERERVHLTLDNYVPFYFVYALLRGPRRKEVLFARRVLVVHGAIGEKRDRITASLKREGVEEVCWLQISQDRSLFDQINCQQWVARVDLCLVGAGIGKPNLLVQLRLLQVPCLDAGYVFEVWADARNARHRAWMIPDADPESLRLGFLSPGERIILENRLNKNEG